MLSWEDRRCTNAHGIAQMHMEMHKCTWKCTNAHGNAQMHQYKMEKMVVAILHK